MSRERRSASEHASTRRAPEPEVLAGRYLVLHEIGLGGMARVQLGRILGPGGFVKPVAVKRLHPHLVGDPGFVSLFLDEARLAARVRHPNVVSILDVLEVVDPGLPVEDPEAQQLTEVLLVLEYVEGETLQRLMRASRARGELLDTSLIVSILSGVLHGLYAAHRAMDAQGEPLQLVHRDVSPQNIMLGSDGVARVLDFGVAKGTGRIQSTRDGEIKGKLRYMAPEQVLGTAVDARSDVFAAGAVLFEALTGEPLIRAATQAEGLDLLLHGQLPRLADYADNLEQFQPVLDRALDRDAERRFQTALEFAIALEAVQAPAPHHEVAEWLEALAQEHLAKRREQLLQVETLDLSALATPPRELLDSSTSWARPPTPALGVKRVGQAGVHQAPSGVGQARNSALGPRAGGRGEALPAEASNPHWPRSRPSAHTATLGGTATPRGASVSPPPASSASLRGAYVMFAAALLLTGFAIWIAFRGGLAAEPAPSQGASLPAAPAALGPPAKPRSDQAPSVSTGEKLPLGVAPLRSGANPDAGAATPAPSPAQGRGSAAQPSAAQPSTAQPSTGRSARSAAPPSTSKVPAAAKPRSAECLSPVTVDDNGIKRIKPECL